jgi:high-affinity Fe2+/Pb2+ permease
LEWSCFVLVHYEFNAVMARSAKRPLRHRGAKWVESPKLPLAAASLAALISSFLTLVVIRDIVYRLAGHPRPHVTSIIVAAVIAVVLALLALRGFRSWRQRRTSE